MKRFLARALLAAIGLGAILAASLPEPAHATGTTRGNCSVPNYLSSTGKGLKFDQTAGGTISLTSSLTSGTVDFGFEADVVGIFVEAPNTGNGAWFRPGTTLTDSIAAALADKSGMTIVATSVDNFIGGTKGSGGGTGSGTGGVMKGSAFPIITDTASPQAGANSPPEMSNLMVSCMWLPVKTRGIAAVHGSKSLGLVTSTVSQNVTVHVIGLGQSGNE